VVAAMSLTMTEIAPSSYHAAKWRPTSARTIADVRPELGPFEPDTMNGSCGGARLRPGLPQAQALEPVVVHMEHSPSGPEPNAPGLARAALQA
jgi:hypothetical protein